MTRQHWPKWVLAMIYVAMCTQGSMTICQENPVPPPLNVNGKIVSAWVEGLVFGKWKQQEHGGFVFFEQRCRVSAHAKGNNNEPFQVSFRLGVVVAVAADEIGEVANPFGEGTRKDYAKYQLLSVGNSTNEQIAAPWQQNVDVDLLTDEFIVPEWIVAPPRSPDFSLRDGDWRVPANRWVNRSVAKAKRQSLATTSQRQLMAGPANGDKWQVEVLNVLYLFGAVDVPTESLTKVLDMKFDQIMVGLMLE